MNNINALVRRYPLLIFFGLVFLLEWILVAPLALSQPAAVGLIAFLPTPCALLVAWLADGRNGLRDIRTRTKLWRMGTIWLLATIGIPLLIGMAAAVVSLILGSNLNIPLAQLPVLAVATLVLAAGEEIGWRGLAFPSLLQQHPPLQAGIIFGIIHGFFHWPMFLLPLPDELRQASPLLLFVVMTSGFAIISMWLFIHTQGSVFIGILYHAFINLSAVLVSGAPKETIGWLLPTVWVVAAVILVIWARVGLARPPESLYEPATKH
ncbi:MAG: CPBP family intramembrane glutamic endopeptidase [Anaerolineae bacterium]